MVDELEINVVGYCCEECCKYIYKNDEYLCL